MDETDQSRQIRLRGTPDSLDHNHPTISKDYLKVCVCVFAQAELIHASASFQGKPQSGKRRLFISISTSLRLQTKHNK